MDLSRPSTSKINVLINHIVDSPDKSLQKNDVDKALCDTKKLEQCDFKTLLKLMLWYLNNYDEPNLFAFMQLQKIVLSSKEWSAFVKKGYATTSSPDAKSALRNLLKEDA